MVLLGGTKNGSARLGAALDDALVVHYFEVPEVVLRGPRRGMAVQNVRNRTLVMISGPL